MMGMAWLAVAPAPGAAAHSAAREEVAAQLPAWLQASDTPSAAIALVQHGQLQWTLVAGEQSAGTPATAATLYNVASLTKPITAEVVLRSAAAGLLDLDQPMAPAWLDPDLAADPQRHALTPRLCLSHQCGFPNWRRDTGGVLRIQWPPGSRAAYSGEGYEYVARYLEAVGGAALEQLARQRLFGPLGMTRTAYTRQPWFERNVAVPRGPDGAPGEPDVRSVASAADDLHTTIGDFGRFAASVARQEGLTPALAAQRWRIDHDVAATLCQPGRLQGGNCPSRMGFALGWVRFETDRETVFFHGGGDWGERAFVLVVPQRRFGIVVLTNGAGGMSVVRNAVRALYANPAVVAFLTMQAGE